MSGPVILLVDPDPTGLRFSSDALITHGYSVMTAVDGRQGHAAVRSHPPALLVTEVLMPEMDGIELITAIRHSDSAMPILAISGRLQLGTLELLELARLVGASATLPKPFTAEELATNVATLLSAMSHEANGNRSSIP